MSKHLPLFGLVGIALLSTLINLPAQDVRTAPDPSSDSEVEKYTQSLYKMIYSRWYLAAEQNATTLKPGTVVVRFFIRSNGSIDQVSLINSSPQSDVLQQVAVESIKRAYMGPFSESMRMRLGGGYWDDLTFTLNDNGESSITGKEDFSKSLPLNPIGGAFGISFGDVYVPKNELPQTTKTFSRYPFQPGIRYDDIKDYALSICPTTKRVFEILGQSAPFKSIAEAEDREAVLVKVLETKYGESAQPQAFNRESDGVGISDCFNLERGDRSVSVFIVGPDSPVLVIDYIDSTLEDAATSEYQALLNSKILDAAKKVDSGGL